MSKSVKVDRTKSQYGSLHNNRFYNLWTTWLNLNLKKKKKCSRHCTRSTASVPQDGAKGCSVLLRNRKELMTVADSPICLIFILYSFSHSFAFFYIPSLSFILYLSLVSHLSLLYSLFCVLHFPFLFTLFLFAFCLSLSHILPLPPYH